MDFFQLHKEKIIYGVIVVILVILLHFLTNFFYKRMARITSRKFSSGNTKSLQLVKYILNALWLVLGLFKLYYLSTPEESYTYLDLTKDFKLIVYIGVVAVITLVGASFVNMWFKLTIKKRTANNSDTTSLKFFRYVLIISIYFIGLLLITLAFPSLRNIAQTALGGAGILAIVLAVASQEALSNIIGGFLIILFKPYKIGDVIKIDATLVGTVKDITLRHTSIQNFDNQMIVIPNSIINKEKLINANLGELKSCERIEIGISYDSDVDLAKKIMQEECEKHPLLIDNRTNKQIEQGVPLVKTAITELGDFAVTVRAWAWVNNLMDAYQIRWDIYENVKKRFDKEGIEIPFPYRTIVMKKDDNKIGSS